MTGGELQTPLFLTRDSRPLWTLLRHQAGLTQMQAAIAVAGVAAAGWVSYSRSNRCYPRRSRYFPPGWTWRNVVGAVDRLDALGLIDHDRRPPGRRGTQSSFCARPDLVTLVNGICPVASLPFLPPRETIILRDRQTGDLMEYRDTAATLAMRRGVAALNARLFVADIVPRLSGGVVRIFNDDFSSGGRFYALGQGNWQGMSATDRARIRIDNQPVIEIDFKALHPTLLYAEAGMPPPPDPYALPDWPRPLVKKALLVLLNAATDLSARRALASDDAMAEVALPSTQEAFRAADALISELRQLHAPIAHAFGTDAGIRLMRQDSDLAANVLARLAAQGIIALPVHDSFLVAVCHADALEAAMLDAARDHGAALCVTRK